MRRAGDDQRRARFVDQDVVDFVDDRVVQRTLRLLAILGIAIVAAPRRTHVVAQVVETELVVRAVGDVAGVGLLPLLHLHVRLDRADGQAQPHVQRRHPLHVAAGQVVVDRHDVDALAFQRVEIGGQRGHQRLAFAGHHFGDRAAVQHHAANQLHVVMPHRQVAAPRLATGRKGLDQNVVQRLAGRQPLAELGRLRLQLLVRHGLKVRLQPVDRLDLGLQPLDVAGIGRSEERRDRPLEDPCQAGEKQPDQFPNTFQQFHGLSVTTQVAARKGCVSDRSVHSHRPTWRIRESVALGRQTSTHILHPRVPVGRAFRQVQRSQSAPTQDTLMTRNIFR